MNIAPRCISVPSCVFSHMFTVRICEAWGEDSGGVSLPGYFVSLLISDLPHTAPRV